MSRHLENATIDQVHDRGDLDILRQGASLLVGDMKGLGKGLFGGGKKKKEEQELGFDEDSDDGKEEAGAGDDDYEEDYSGSDYEDDDDADGGVNRLMGDDEDFDEDEEDGDGGFFETAGAMLSGGALGAATALGLRRKTFVCDLHHIRLTNLVRRRRDVLIHFTLGSGLAESGDAVFAGGFDRDEPSADGGDETDDGGRAAAAASGDAGASDAASASGGTGKRRSMLRRRSSKGGSGGGGGGGGGAAGSTSKPVLFKTDVASKPERGKAHPLRATFRGKWRGRYEDLPHRVLHMCLYEQTRFGNLVEIGQAAIPLLELATGSVQQEVTFVERDGRATVEVYRCNFHCHFQERFTFVLRFVDWRGSNLRATDDSNSSDPYLKFYIRGSAAKRYSNWYKRGGVIGRSTSTEVQYNTLFPHYSEAKRPIFYHGTRSDLENEVLRIEVWDWDVGKDDLIGFADVPLRGVLLSGRIATGLAMRAGGGPLLGRRKSKALGTEGAGEGGRLITAGELEGAIEVAAEPMHTQFGDVVKRLPKMTYLALNVRSCLDLIGKRVDGMSDPYVTAVWAGTSQQTRVIRATCSPTYDETLYFPTNLVRNTAAELEAKGDLVLYVLHKTQKGAAPEDIGFVRLPLARITDAPVTRVDDAGSLIKTRTYEATLRLQQQGVRQKDGGKGQIELRAYFTPDLSPDVRIQQKELEAHQLERSFEERELSWREDIPARMRATGRYLCKALDETNTMRFLPTYLAKCAPPRDVSDPMTIARMVNCITFQLDSHIGAGGKAARGGGEELWSSPNYFLDVKKGASEDHAILQCNLFLGLGMDAYLAIGRLPGGIQQHVWVVTREPNGDVKFWETTKGDFYTLPGRWTGLFLDGTFEAIPKGLLTAKGGDESGRSSADPAERAARAAAAAARRLSKAEAKYGSISDADTAFDKRKQRAALALAQDKAAREAERKALEQAAAQKREETLLYLAGEEHWTMDLEGNPFETPRDFDEKGGHRALMARFGEEGYHEGLDEHGYPVGGWLNPQGTHKLTRLQDAIQDVQTGVRIAGAMRAHSTAAQRKTASLKSGGRRPSGEKDGGSNVLPPAKKAGLESMLGADGSGAGSGGGGGGGGGGAAPKRKLGSAGKTLPELLLPPMKEQLPYETLEVLVNHENIWANVQGQSIPTCGFDLEDEDRWLPFIAKGVWEPPVPPRPFYSVGRIGPKLPPARLSALRLQLFHAIRTAYTEWRSTRSLRTRWAARLEPVLDQGLATLERAKCSSLETDARAVDKWRGELLASLPPDYHFCGRAFSFSITTPELIVDYLMTQYPYHENGHKEIAFALSVQCFAHYGAVASTWVYLGWLAPHARRKNKNKDED